MQSVLPVCSGTIRSKEESWEVLTAEDHSFSPLTLNAFTASDGIVVPMQCEFYALEGLSQLMITIGRIKRMYNDKLIQPGEEVTASVTETMKLTAQWEKTVNITINVTINHETGEIALDSAVLFGVNESNISPEGKEFLRSFLNVYTGVVFGDEYTDFVSKIMVEGHTDTSGSYDLNLSLSQARADSVLAFCLSEEAGIDPAYVESLTGTLEAVGYSYDKPVYDENGDVDMDASRRVSFRFVIKIGD